MNDNHEPRSVASSVMEQINSGTVKMKPRLYFMVLATVSAAVVVLAGLAMAYLWSIVLLWIRIETAATPARGARANLAEAIESFPWWAVVCAVLLLAVVVVVVRHQGRFYRHRTTTIALLLIVSSLLIGGFFSAFDIGRSHTPNRFEGRESGRGDATQRLGNPKSSR